MKKLNISKLVSLIFVFAMLMCAIAIPVFATEEQETVEISKKNIIFGEKLQLMFAVKAPDDVQVSAVCGNDEIEILSLGKGTIEGVEYHIFQTVDAWAPQNINAVVTVTATSGDKTDKLSYSVLMYLYERLNLDDLDPVEEADRIAMYESLLEYAMAADKVINNQDGRTPNELDKYHYVSVIDGTVDGYNTWGMFKEGDTPFANIEHSLIPDEDDVVLWFYSLNGGENKRIDLEDLKNLTVEGPLTITATTAHGLHVDITDEWTAVSSFEELVEAAASGGHYHLTSDIEANASIVISTELTLCLNGHTLSSVEGEENFSILSVSEGATLNLVDCGTEQSTVYVKDGILVDSTTEGATAVELTGGRITANHAVQGSAIWAKGTVNIHNVNFIGCSSNTAGSNSKGGAIYVWSGELNVTDSTFVANSTMYEGGAIDLSGVGSEEAPYTITNTRFIGNYVSNNNYGGGAIYSTGSHGILEDVTFIGNHSCKGGAVALHSGSTLTVYSLIAQGNYAAEYVNEEGGTSLGQGGVFYLNSSTLRLTERAGTDDKIVIGGTEEGQGNSAVRGGAIYVTKNVIVPEVEIVGAEFIGNTSGNGGAIYADRAVITLDGATFSNNEATGAGGAIQLDETTLTISGAKTTFSGNFSENSGGAIHSYESALNITGALFSNNESVTMGGAIYIDSDSEIEDDPEVTITNTDFSNNTAGSEGGAIYIRVSKSYSIVGGTFEGNKATFCLRGGGAIYSTISHGTISGTTFRSNSGTKGGAIALHSNSSLSISAATFDSNSAAAISPCKCGANPACSYGWGGAIYANNSTLDLVKEGEGNISFSNNSAVKGGAIFVENNAKATLNGVTLSSNSATNGGGAMYITAAPTTIINSKFDQNSSNAPQATYEGGGAIFVIGTTLNVTDTTFTKNSSAYYGGAIAADTSSTKVYITGGEISESTGRTGSALWFRGCTEVNLTGVEIKDNVGGGNGVIYFSGGTNTFTNVTASGNGTASGVIYISGGNLIIRGGTFTNNAITENGGVLCVKSNTKNVTIEKYIDGETEKAAIFTENSAKYGGAISVEGGTVAISGAEFTSNTASKSGGAVYVSGGTVTISDAKFTSNSVPQTTEYVNVGGAIAVGSATLTVENSSFTGNSAFSGGAIGTLDATDPKLTVSGCTFEENVAYKNGGAFFVQTQPATEEERILIDGCTFIGNDSGIAAGSALYMRYTSTVTISNVVAYNGTTAWGGDFYATTNSKFTFRGTVQLKETESSTADTVTFGSSATAVVEYKDDAEKAAWEAVLGTGSKITYTLIETEQEGGEQEGEDPVE